jgi:hypothetical protein
MRYLGGSSGSGTLVHDGKEIARATYDFDRFYERRTGTLSCGEIAASAETLRSVFQQKSLQLVTDDGRLLTLKFSDPKLPEASEFAHVDVKGDWIADCSDAQPSLIS